MASRITCALLTKWLLVVGIVSSTSGSRTSLLTSSLHRPAPVTGRRIKCSENMNPCDSLPGLCSEGGGLCVVQGPCEYVCRCPPDGRLGRDCLNPSQPAFPRPAPPVPGTKKVGSLLPNSLLIIPHDLFWDFNHVAKPADMVRTTGRSTTASTTTTSPPTDTTTSPTTDTTTITSSGTDANVLPASYRSSTAITQSPIPPTAAAHSDIVSPTTPKGIASSTAANSILPQTTADRPPTVPTTQSAPMTTQSTISTSTRKIIVIRASATQPPLPRIDSSEVPNDSSSASVEEDYVEYTPEVKSTTMGTSPQPVSQQTTQPTQRPSQTTPLASLPPQSTHPSNPPGTSTRAQHSTDGTQSLQEDTSLIQSTSSPLQSTSAAPSRHVSTDEGVLTVEGGITHSKINSRSRNLPNSVGSAPSKTIPTVSSDPPSTSQTVPSDPALTRRTTGVIEVRDKTSPSPKAPERPQERPQGLPLAPSEISLPTFFADHFQQPSRRVSDTAALRKVITRVFHPTLERFPTFLRHRINQR